MKIKEEEYKKVKPFFEKPDVNCAKIGLQIHMTPAKVLTYYSIFLRDKMKNSQYIKTKEAIEKEKRCPTCGKLKHEVTDPAVCRDVFHYL